MTAPDPAWVEAVANAFIEKMWIHRNDREYAVEMAEEAVATVEPLIREQIAAEMTVTHPAPVDEAALRAVRRETAEQIAEAIEAGHEAERCLARAMTRMSSAATATRCGTPSRVGSSGPPCTPGNGPSSRGRDEDQADLHLRR